MCQHYRSRDDTEVQRLDHLRSGRYIYVDEVCGLFKHAGIPDDVAKKKAFPLSLKGDTLIWYRLCDDMRSWDYKKIEVGISSKVLPYACCSS